MIDAIVESVEYGAHGAMITMGLMLLFYIVISLILSAVDIFTSWRPKSSVTRDAVMVGGVLWLCLATASILMIVGGVGLRLVEVIVT